MIVEARQVTVYVHTIDAPARRRRAWDRATAYRHAAWTKIRARCRCEPGEWDSTGHMTSAGSRCRFHDYEFHARGSYDAPPEFYAPRVWRVPHGTTTYGKAVAFRLARWYAFLDKRAETATR